MSNPAVAAIEFALSIDSGDCKHSLNMWMHGDFPEIREAWPEAPEDIYIGADSLHPQTLEQESKSVGVGEPVAHRTLRRNGQGEWVSADSYWLDGAPDEHWVSNLANQPPGSWKIQCAYAHAPERNITQAALDVLNEHERQIVVEQRTPEEDNQWVCDELAALTALYMMPPAAREWDASSTGYGDTLAEAMLPPDWSFKPSTQRRRELVKAVALGLAELERLDRAAESNEGSLSCRKTERA